MGKILCIIDGMTDENFDSSNYYNLSKLRCAGYIDTCKGQRAESLNCILHLLGIKNVPENLRAYVEAVGLGVKLDKDDLVLRGSFYSIGCDGYPKDPINAPKSKRYENFDYIHIDTYKSLIILPKLAGQIDHIKTMTPYENIKKKAEKFRPEGSKILSDIFDIFWEDESFLIPWGQAVNAELPRFERESAVICGADIVKGIAKMLGMELYFDEDFTADIDTNLRKKADLAVNLSNRYPFVLLHINGADEESHRKNSDGKKNFLKKVDDIVIKKLISSDCNIVITSDHGTSPVTGMHLDFKQPIFTKEMDFDYDEFIRN